MTAASTAKAPAPAPAGSTPGQASSRTLRLPKGTRSTRMMGVLCVVLGAALAAIVAVATLGGDQVVVAARDIPAGTVITQQDLQTGQLRGDGIATIPADQARSLIGKTAVGPVPDGAVLAPDMVAEEPPPGPGQAAVGLNLKPGQLPGVLDPGRHVSVLLVSGADSAAADAVPARTVLVDNAEVLEVTSDPGGTWLVTVSVPAPTAADVASAASAGRAAVVLLPVGA